VDYNRRTSVTDEGVRTIFERCLFVFYSSTGFAIGPDREIRHVAGVVALWIIEPVLLILRIEMPTGRFEVGAFALGRLVKMDSVHSGCKVMQAELEGNTRALIPNRYATDIFALSIFKFNLGLGGARGWENYQREEQS
jgi:hypothetical protein